MPHPFLYLAAALSAGILARSAVPASPLVCIVPAGVSLAAAWTVFLSRRHHTPVFILILTCAFFLGAGFHSQAEHEFSNNGLRRIQETEYLDFTGILYKSPSFGIDNDYLYVKVNQVHHSGKNLSVSGRLKVSLPRSAHSPRLKHLLAGDRLTVSARLIHSRGFKNFKQPTRDFYLKMDHIHKQAFCKSPLLVHKKKAAPVLSPRRFFSGVRLRIQSVIETYFSRHPPNLTPAGAVLEALLLGARERVRDDTRQTLQHSGLYHLMAISGAHVAVLSFMFFFLLKSVRVPERTACLCVTAGLVFYAFLVEGRPSVIRATMVMVFFLAGKWLWRDSPVLNTLSLSALVLLVFHPFDLFAAGFQLTFAATLSIVLFYPVIIKKLPRLPGKFSEVFAVSLAAQIGVLPFIAAAFNRVSFGSLLLNYPALPLVTVIMAGGYLFLLTAGLLPFISAHMVKGLDFVIRQFISLAELSHYAPALSFRIPDPYPGIAAGYFGCLIAWAVLKPKWGKIISGTGFVIFAAVLIWHPFPHHSPHLRVTYIDVGQGDAALIEFPGRKVMLIDGGGFASGRFDVGEQVVSRVLWKKGIKKIDYLACSHPHPDHFYGLPSISRNFRVSEFWEAAIQAEQPAYQNFLDQLAPETRRRRLLRGDTIRVDAVTVKVLHPPPSFSHPAVNNHSLVLRLEYGRHAFLFTGDIEKEAEYDILTHTAGTGIRSQVLKSPHHGSESSSTSLFLNAAAPKIVVITAGEHNRYGLPKESILRRYREAGARIFRTDLHGAVEITSDGTRFSVRTASSPPPGAVSSAFQDKHLFPMPPLSPGRKGLPRLAGASLAMTSLNEKEIAKISKFFYE